jgi:hypothetical protein
MPGVENYEEYSPKPPAPPSAPTLGGIQNRGSEPQPSVNDISSYYPEGFQPVEAQRSNPFEDNNSRDIVNLGYNKPINVGSYSGSIVGNIPIFVDNSMVATTPNAYREQRLALAAQAKAKEIKQLEDDLYKVPQLKNAPDQPEMNDIYLGGVEKWKQMYGGDIKTMSKDPRFQAWMNDVKTAGKINDAAYEQYAQMGKEMDEGKMYFSPDTREAYKSFLAGAATLSDPTNPEAQNFTSKAFKLNQSYDLDLAVNDALQHYKAQVIESDPTKKDMGIYDMLTTTEETNKDRNLINELADSVYENKFKGTNTFTKEEVRARFQKALPYTKKNQLQTHANQFAPRENSGGNNDAYSYNNKETARGISTQSRGTSGNEKVQTSFTLNNVYKTTATDQSKVVSVPISQGLKYTDGKAVTGNGYVRGTVSDIGVAPVYKKGLKLPVKTGVDKDGRAIYETKDVGGMVVGSVDVDKPGTTNKNPSFYNMQSVAMFNVTETQEGETGKDQVNRTVVMPLNEVIGHYAKPDKKQGELDLTDMANDVQKQAKLQDNERLKAVDEYNRTENPKTVGKNQKKSVSSSKSKGGLKPIGPL